jgi:hypothetical protein
VRRGPNSISAPRLLGNRQTGGGKSDEEICADHGLTLDRYWEILLREDQRASSFERILITEFLDLGFVTPDHRSYDIFRLNFQGALKEALETGQTCVRRPSEGDYDDPIVSSPCAFLEWLIRNPKRSYLVSTRLRAYIESRRVIAAKTTSVDQPPPSTDVAPPSSAAKVVLDFSTINPAHAAKSPSRSKQKRRGGRTPAADWVELRTILARRINDVGRPGISNEKGWQSQEDVVHWMAGEMGERGEKADDRTIREHVREMLESIGNKAEKTSRLKSAKAKSPAMGLKASAASAAVAMSVFPCVSP